MELFDTHFFQFGQVLAVSGTKMLAISNHYLQVVKSQQHLDYFQNTHSKMKTNIKLWMYTLNGTVWYRFCSVWSSISCFRHKNVSYKWPLLTSGKITTVPRLFSDHSLKKENKHQIMNVPLNGTVWYTFWWVWWSISCFRPENVSYK